MPERMPAGPAGTGQDQPAAAETALALAADPQLAPLRRSLAIYYGDPAREAAMDALYARFLQPGDLAFDIGSHVGDRIASFRRLGAAVVAVEPQPLCARATRVLYRHDALVTVIEAACAARAGAVTMYVNSANRTVSSASPGFVRAAGDAPGWEGQVWDHRLAVPATTLDRLIADHGVPAFMKIDVEGYEDAVLTGLSTPVRAMSFEFTTIAREVALRCLDRLAALGPYRFDLSLGERHELVFGRWVPAGIVADHLRALPPEANSGDIYCVLPEGRGGR